MTYVTLPNDEARRLSFYLAMEEFLAYNRNEGEDLFFMWQVEPSVIFGRNQVIENEVNIDYCRQHGIQMYRRKSGGGCVYADMGNLMLSYITRSEQVPFTFHRYMTLIASVLVELGLKATTTENNDVLIEGRKVSGNAFYHIPGHSIVHGTLLFDTNMPHMLNAITPPQVKLSKHGVQSVRQRITLLKEHTSMSLDEFKQFFISRFCNNQMVLTDNDVEEISALEQKYLDSTFIYGRHSHE
ncbi:MAG: lipoate--protein ligase family protein [Bacteroidaceae bacterium]|nr:lipoate--protein ligase family protein [Bacteroidaceae bacterium]